MSELVLSQSLSTRPAANMPPVPWRDPHTVSRVTLREHINQLEQACVANPDSADLRTCLGMAYAMNFEVYSASTVLEQARDLDPQHFWAQLKYAELQYRLRALSVAEQETLRALDLASNPTEYALSRKLLQEIRRLMREGTQKPAWTKPLLAPALISLGFAVLLCLGVALR